MLRKVVVDNQRVAAAVAEVLTDSARRVRADVEHRRRVGGGRRDDDRVAHRVVLFEGANDLRHRRLLLTDRVVDTDDALAALVDDRVHGHRGLSGLPVTDDQFALATTDGHHPVDRLEASLQRFFHGLSVDDAGGQSLDWKELLALDRPLAVNRLAEGVDDAAEHLLANGNGNDAAGTLDLVAFLDLPVVAQQDCADAVLFEIQRDAENAVGELDHFAGHRPLDAMDARDAVADRDHGADFRYIDGHRIAADLIANDLGDFFRSDIHL
jgi:hypothetical protein